MGKEESIGLCCWSPRCWAKTIARIQVALNTIGFIIFGVILIGLLELGQDGFEQAKEEGKRPESFTDMTYSALITYLLISLGLCFIGALFGGFLLKGAYENKTSYLRCWILFGVICFCWSMFYAMFDPGTVKILTMIMIGGMYGFSVYVVHLLINDIDRERNLSKNRFSCTTRLLRSNKPFTYKPVLLGPSSNSVV